MRYVFSVILVFVCFTVNFAQLIEVPLASNPEIVVDRARPSLRNGVVCDTQTLSLPFFDDFAYDLLYPNCNYWLNDYSYVSQTLGVNPPSIGVAVFDGIGSDGMAYNQFVSNVSTRPADTLTTQFIDLSGLTPSDSIYLSFYIQPTGLGNRPEINDTLMLEFKNSSGDWIYIDGYSFDPPLDSPSTYVPDFDQQAYAITDTDFLHDNFQFRFTNYASINANNDHWLLDYVYLRSMATLPTDFYSDVAYVYAPQSPLSNYTAIPWNHFIGFESSEFESNNVDLSINNLFNSSFAITAQHIVVEDNFTGSTVLDNEINNALLSLGNGISNLNDDITSSDVLDLSLFSSVTGPTTLTSTYILSFAGQSPEFNRNDTATLVTELSNFYAYDDGSAESRVVAQNTGTTIAVEFTSTTNDSLRGFAIHIEDGNDDISNDRFNLKAYLNDLNTEVLSDDFATPYPVSTINGWTTYAFSQPIYVPAGSTFYVGWQTATTDPVPVGFDKNINSRTKSWVNTSGTWNNLNASLKGSLMIRPILSSTPIFTTPIDRLPKTESISLYPNPARDKVYFSDTKNQVLTVQLFDVSGKLFLEDQITTELDITNVPSGAYILRIENASREMIQSSKLIVTK